jgi:hypothetical protein
VGKPACRRHSKAIGMTMEKLPLNRKETYSVGMVIFIGFYYALSLGSSLIQSQNLARANLFGLTESKYLFLCLFFWSGALSFFRQKNRGWVICTATLLNYVVVVLNAVVSILKSQQFDAFAAMSVSLLLLLLMAFLFIFNGETREKFRVNNKSYILTIAVYIMLLLITFLL